MFTFAFTHNPLLPPPPRGWDCGSYFLVTGPAQRTAQFFWMVEGRKEEVFNWGWGGDRMSCHIDAGPVGPAQRGPRCGDVRGWGRRRTGRGVGIRSSKDKHQWEYERLDANRSGSHAIPSQKKPQERAWPCCFLWAPSKTVTETISS